MVATIQEAINATMKYFEDKIEGWTTFVDPDLARTFLSWQEHAVHTKDPALQRDLRRISTHVEASASFPGFRNGVLKLIGTTPVVQMVLDLFIARRKESYGSANLSHATGENPTSQLSSKIPLKKINISHSAKFWAVLSEAPFESTALQGPLQLQNVRTLLVRSFPLPGFDCPTQADTSATISQGFLRIHHGVFALSP